MMRISLFLLGTLLISCTVHAQFQICNSSTSKSLYDVYFFDANTGLAVGDSGVIVRSVDGGLNWTTVMADDSVSFTKVKFFDSLTGIAVGSDIYKTVDAGLNWTRVPFDNSSFYDVEILNSTTCVISGNPTGLIKSTDRCLTFDTLVSQGGGQGQEEFGLLSFVDDQIGYACPIWGGFSNHTQKTTDGGITWNVIMDTNSFANPTVMEALNFISEDIGFKGGWYNSHLEKSISGGYNWEIADFTDSLAYHQLIDFHIEPNQPNAYYSCGWYGELFKSIDGGDTWFQLDSVVSGTTSLLGIYFVDDLTGWAVGLRGTIIRTTTGGVVVGLEEPVFDGPIGVTLFPNPSSGSIEISYDKVYKIHSLRLSDMNGRTIPLLISSYNQLDLTALSKGIYLLEIETDKGNWVGRVVKD